LVGGLAIRLTTVKIEKPKIGKKLVKGRDVVEEMDVEM
jgi:hypothetical protein